MKRAIKPQVVASVVWGDKGALQEDESVFWENRILLGLSREFDRSCYHSTQF